MCSSGTVVPAAVCNVILLFPGYFINYLLKGFFASYDVVLAYFGQIGMPFKKVTTATKLNGMFYVIFRYTRAIQAKKSL